MRTIRSIAVIFAIGLVASACGGNDDDLGSLVPFAEVQDSEFVFEADPFAPDRGIFRVTTTEPMICTIVWGETDAFGNFNNSLEMNGTGIIDHNVSLPGAEPGKEYVFPIPVQLTEVELNIALSGKLVTRVIYLENPRNALPIRETEGFQIGSAFRGFSR